MQFSRISAVPFRSAFTGPFAGFLYIRIARLSLWAARLSASHRRSAFFLPFCSSMARGFVNCSWKCSWRPSCESGGWWKMCSQWSICSQDLFLFQQLPPLHRSTCRAWQRSDRNRSWCRQVKFPLWTWPSFYFFSIYCQFLL